jgi:hypothetical protein
MSVKASDPPTMGQQITTSLIGGTEVMFKGALFVNGFNRIATVCCDRNLPMFRSIGLIYSGAIEGKPPSLRHFGVGMEPFLTKEIARLGAKSTGLTMFKPRLADYFRGTSYAMWKTNFVFSATLSFWEWFINPVDTLCTTWQARGFKVAVSDLRAVPRGQLIGRLYHGAVANGFRQLLQWLGYTVSDDLLNEFFEAKTPINPHEIFGIAVKSMPEGVIVTTPAYILQRYKTEIQCNPQLAQTAEQARRLRLAVVIEHIIKTQTVWGLCKGLFPKSISNGFLIAGLSYLTEQAKLAKVK